MIYRIYFELSSGFIDFYDFDNFDNAILSRNDLLNDKFVVKVSDVTFVEIDDSDILDDE